MNRFAPRVLAAAVAAAASAAFAGPPASAPDAATTSAAPTVAQPFKDVGLWYGQFGGTICSWLDTGAGVFLIDTASSAADAKALKAEIAKTTKNKPVKWIALTHLHSDSNEGLASFLPSDTMILVNARSAGPLAEFVGGLKGPAPSVIGVGEHLLLLAGKFRLEVGVPPANAHTASDLYVFDAGTRTAFVGDLVTPDRCPMLSDPDSDIKGWLLALDRLDALNKRGSGNRKDPALSHEHAPVSRREEKAECSRGAGDGRARRGEDRRLLPARTGRDQCAQRLPADRDGRDDRARLRPPEGRAEVIAPGPGRRGARASTVV
jgi:glyoxylase-like metal-dependent hydrolase (beta-lactamase superfamily II)